MDLADLISRTRGELSVFDYDHYPDSFARFERAAADFFGDLGEDDCDAAAEALIAGLEDGWSRLSRKERKTAEQEDKQVLAYFLAPAARRCGGPAVSFAEILSRKWNARYPRNPFYPGDFDVILKGFDANLLGLPLRKSKKRG